jgi:hypothetical protein
VAQTTHSGYTLARMKYAILLAPEAVDDFRGLKANVRSRLREAIEEHLRHEPAKISKSRIKWPGETAVSAPDRRDPGLL